MVLKLHSGEKIARGRYILRRYVSRGAHAELWEAEQTGTEGFRRKVAIKIVGNREGLSDPARESLLREGRLAARLNHPNIIQLYEVGQEERFVYIAMEFIHGVDLRRCLRAHYEQFRRPLPWHIVARMGALIARGLEHAHNQIDEDGTPLRIVHRDVKPSNVLFSHDGLIKLIDFGIAKSLTLSNSRSIEFKGTVAYVSPEQIRSEELDHRSDIFSFGVLLYELISGMRPFDVEEGGFGGAMLATLERQPLSLLDLVPDLPPAIDRLVFSMLEKEPHHRPSSDREVYSVLDDVLRERGIVLEQEHLTEFYDNLLGESDATVYNVQGAEAAKMVQEALRSRDAIPSLAQQERTQSHPQNQTKPLWDKAHDEWDDDDDSDTIPASAGMDIHAYLKSKLKDTDIHAQPQPIKADEND
ncbi:MAG: serine/threonine protein kinase, partial [Myxococcales bacterium]|nr:serine/threonine protein kinase [Myxococcales bacterium]